MKSLTWSYCHSYQYCQRQFKLIINLQALFCLWTVSSAQSNGIPRAIPIFDVTTPNGNIDRAGINSVLDQVGDKLIKVISINGPSRSGKSFLLSYFIRHFKSQSGDVEGLLSGFEWRGGHEGVTVGINLWSKPYFVKTEVGEIAILLLDTQGLFDKKTTYRQNAIIFTISSLLSSLFMYNQKDVVLENTLQNINCFSNLEHNIANEVKLSKSAEALGLPSSLMFLLRDFDMAEYKYGLHTSTSQPESSPSNYIVDLFSSNSEGTYSPRQTVNPEENLRVRSKLQKLYFNITAFVMPHPGRDFLLDVVKNKPCNAFQVQAQSLIQSSISTKTLMNSRLDFGKILDTIEHVCSNSVKYSPLST